jgi:PepSY-associated TM region
MVRRRDAKMLDAMMRGLILLHRWLGVAFCLLFAMWFASGIVMLFVSYPVMPETERFAGLAPLNVDGVVRRPAEAVAVSGIAVATRVRLLQRSDGPIYVVSAGSAMKAVRAVDLSDGTVTSAQLALKLAIDYAHRRGQAEAKAQFAALAPYDQWTLSAAFDAHRPLYRVALNDSLGTELYVSSTTGEVVLETVSWQRRWNYPGSVAHWIYPMALRSHPAAWSRLVWWLSLLALIGATTGAVIGLVRIEINGGYPRSPYGGWQAWHHGLGVCSMLFVWSWIFSGWLSMDDGLLFSTGRPTRAEATAIAGAPAWTVLSNNELRVEDDVREVEWFAFAGQIYRRDRFEPNLQRLVRATPPAAATGERSYLEPDEVNAVASRLAPSCRPATAVPGDDNYAVVSSIPDAPVFRLICGNEWFDIDASNGSVLQKLDPSRRIYRWLYGALHTFDIPAFTSRPALRTIMIAGLCGCGFVFSLTGVVIAWRRLWSCTEITK